MTSVTLAGKSGSISEVVEIGPTSLVRRRNWANLGPLADGCSRAGLHASVLPAGDMPSGLESPSVWLLSDLPFLAAEAWGILARLTADVPSKSGLVMIGGAFSFAGLNGLGGWQDPRGAVLLPVDPGPGADDTEVPQGTRVVPDSACPPVLADLLAGAPLFFGYNRLRPRDDASVLAHFDDGAAALVISPAMPHRVVAFATDLLPHWGPAAEGWEGLPDLLGGLCELAVGIHT